jgi:hypothetical protein
MSRTLPPRDSRGRFTRAPKPSLLPAWWNVNEELSVEVFTHPANCLELPQILLKIDAFTLAPLPHKPMSTS